MQAIVEASAATTLVRQIVCATHSAFHFGGDGPYTVFARVTYDQCTLELEGPAESRESTSGE